MYAASGMACVFIEIFFLYFSDMKSTCILAVKFLLALIFGKGAYLTLPMLGV